MRVQARDVLSRAPAVRRFSRQQREPHQRALLARGGLLPALRLEAVGRGEGRLQVCGVHFSALGRRALHTTKTGHRSRGFHPGEGAEAGAVSGGGAGRRQEEGDQGQAGARESRSRIFLYSEKPDKRDARKRRERKEALKSGVPQDADALI